jgi:glycosyltransferase involved in cell wall biosynthesis
MAFSSFSNSGKGNPPLLAHRVNGIARDHAIIDYRPVSAALAIAPSVSIILPVINEAANLPHVFATLPEWVDEVVLVDGHSTDETVAVTRRLRPDIKIVTQPGKGKGDALRAGFNACRGDIIVAIDGDGSTDGREILQFVSALVAGADFAKGSRFSSGGGSDDITIRRRLGNKALNILVNRLFGTQYSDLCYGYNAFWSRHLPDLSVDCPGFEIEALMSISAAKAGLAIQEIPSHERRRLHGTSNLKAVRDGWRILKIIFKERFSSSPPSGYVSPPPVAVLETMLPAASAESGQESR